jgi:predicted MFS family arabinose efflux permease
MQRDLLGPVHEAGAPPRRLMSDLASVTAELWAGARYAIRRRGPATALGATGGSKFLYGILFVMSILLYRNYFYPSSAPVAEGHYLVLASISGIGYFCAALVVPPAVRRLSKPTLITLLLAVCAVATAVFGETFVQVAFLAFGFFLYLTSQGVAICATTILQEEVADAYRGRMFAFYDVMFNVTIAAGALISVGFMPRTGRSPVLMGVVAAAYAAVAAGYWLLTRQPSAGGEPGTSSPSAAAQSSSS